VEPTPELHPIFGWQLGPTSHLTRPRAVLTDERVNQAVECLLLQRLTNFSKKIAGKPEYNGSIALSSILMLLTESHSNTSLQNNISLQ
jgi:hypothetical protein